MYRTICCRQQTQTSWQRPTGFRDYDKPQTECYSSVGNLQCSNVDPSIHKETTHLHRIMMRTESGSRCHPQHHERIEPALGARSFRPFHGQELGKCPRRKKVVEQSICPASNTGKLGTIQAHSGATASYVFITYGFCVFVWNGSVYPSSAITPPLLLLPMMGALTCSDRLYEQSKKLQRCFKAPYGELGQQLRMLRPYAIFM